MKDIGDVVNRIWQRLRSFPRMFCNLKDSDRMERSQVINMFFFHTMSNAPTDISFPTFHIDGLVQHCTNSIANAVELLQSCAKSSIC